MKISSKIIGSEYPRSASQPQCTLKVYQLPFATVTRGRPIVNILPLEENNVFLFFLLKSLKRASLLMATANGTVKAD